MSFSLRAPTRRGSACRGCPAASRGAAGRAEAGQHERHPRAALRRDPGEDAPAVRLDDRARDREPQASAALAAGARAVEAVEAVEHAVALFRWDPRTVILDGDLDPAAWLRRHAHAHEAVWSGVLDGVASEVAHDLREAVLVGAQRPVGDVAELEAALG